MNVLLYSSTRPLAAKPSLLKPVPESPSALRHRSPRRCVLSTLKVIESRRPLQFGHRRLRVIGMASRGRSLSTPARGAYCDSAIWPRLSPLPSATCPAPHTGDVCHKLAPARRRFPPPPPLQRRREVGRDLDAGRRLARLDDLVSSTRAPSRRRRARVPVGPGMRTAVAKTEAARERIFRVSSRIVVSSSSGRRRRSPLSR